MGKTKAKWEGQRACIFDNEEYEHVLPFNPVCFYDDFLGAWTAVPDVAVALESGCEWAKKIVGAAPPTVALVADTAGGIAQCAMDATSEAQSAFIYMADDRRFIVTQGAVFEARVKVSVLPTLVGEAVWGLAADYDVPDNITYSAWFTADGSGEIFCETDDTGTDQSATSGVTVLATDWKVYRIDFRDVTDVKFYINGSRVASGTTFPYAGTAANATLQPFLGCYKASGAGLGTIQVDYVRIWLNRS
jgi:hypothetical protein